MCMSADLHKHGNFVFTPCKKVKERRSLYYVQMREQKGKLSYW